MMAMKTGAGDANPRNLSCAQFLLKSAFGRANKRGPVTKHSQRVHVGIWSILKVQRGSHRTTLGLKYILYSYMDPLGQETQACSNDLAGEM